MSKYILSQDAEFDLDDIWEYIAQDSVDAADRWIENCSPLLNLLRPHQASATGATT